MSHLTSALPRVTCHRAAGGALFAALAALGLLFWVDCFNINLIKTAVAHPLIFAAFALMVAQTWSEPPPGAKLLRRGQAAPEALRLRWPLAWLIVPLAVVLVFSTLISPFKFAGVRELIRFAAHFAIFYLAANWVRSLGDARRLLRWLIIVAWAASLYGLAQQIGLDPIQWQNLDRIIGTLGNPNFFSGFLILILPVQVVDLLLSSVRGRAWRSAALLCTASAVLLTFTRGAWVGAGVSFAVLAGGLLAYHRRSLLRPAIPALAVVGALGLGIAAWVTFPAVTQASRRVQFSGVTGSTFRVREVAWGAAWRMFEDAPMMGQGLGTYQQFFPLTKGPQAYRSRIGDNTQHAHSEWLEALAETGALGGGLYMMVFVMFGVVSLVAAKQLRRWGQDRQHALLWGLVCGVLAGLVHGSMEVTLRWNEVSLTLWLLMGAGAALWRSLPEEQPPVASAWDQPVSRAAWIAALAACLAVAFPEGRMLASDYALKQGQAWRDAGLIDEGIAHYQRALRLNPWNMEALYQLASAQATQGSPQRALETYQRLREFAPDYASIDTNLHLVYLDLGRGDDARAALERALAKDQTPRNRLLLAEQQSRSGDTQAAASTIAQLASSDPDDLDVYLLGGGLLHSAGLLDQERALLLQGVERFPGEIDLRRALVSLLDQTGDEAALAAQLPGLVARDPLDERAAMRLGDLLEASGEWAEAFDLYQSHVPHFGMSTELAFRIAQAAQRSGDWETARPLLERLSSEASSEVYAMAARQLLMEMDAQSMATTGPASADDLLPDLSRASPPEEEPWPSEVPNPLPQLPAIPSPSGLAPPTPVLPQPQANLPAAPQ